MEFKKTTIFVLSCIIAVIIMLAPIFVTGNPSINNEVGAFLIGDMIMRVVCIIVGMLIIYDALKSNLREE